MFVFGGARGMGRWIAEFLKRRGCAIVLVDPYAKTDEIARQVGVRGIVLPEGDWSSLLAADDECLACDVAVIAVPIAVTEDVIRGVGPKLRPGSLLMDVTSLKTKPMETMEKSVCDGVGVLGTHPMFGPRFGSFFGQTCVVVPSEVCPPQEWLEWWLRALDEEEGLSVLSTAQEHDGMMLLVQVLLHYTIMVFATTVANSKSDLNRCNMFKSPLYEVMMGLAARLCGGPNPDLYYAIQQHPAGAAARAALRHSADLISSILTDGSAADYRKFSSQVREALGESNIISHSAVIDGVFGNLAAHKRALVGMKGQPVCIRNEESKKIHYGILEAVTAEAVILRKPKERTVISLKRARLLDPAETNVWQTANLPRRKKLYSFAATENLDPAFLSNMIGDRAGIAKVSVVDVYNGLGTGPGCKKVSLLVEVPRSPLGEKALEEAECLLLGIGCVTC